MNEVFGYHLYNPNKDNVKRVVDFVLTRSINGSIDDIFVSEEDFETLKRLADDKLTDSINEVFGEPMSWAVADLINESEGITLFAGVQSNKNREYIGIDPRFPWFLTDNDKALSFEQCRRLLEKYAKTLGIDDEPHYYSVEENYGD